VFSFSFLSQIFYVKKLVIFFPQISAKVVEFALEKYIFHSSSKTSVQKNHKPIQIKEETGGFLNLFLAKNTYFTL
jgi:hypothetical protein